MPGTGCLPSDPEGYKAEGVYSPSRKGTVAVKAGTVSVDATTGVSYAPLVAEVDASAINLADIVIQAVSGTALVADMTNSELRVSNYVKTTDAGDTALTLGQAAMAASLPVTIANNQTALATTNANIPAVGQKAMAASIPVVVASNQSTLNVKQVGYSYNAITTKTTTLVLSGAGIWHSLIITTAGSADTTIAVYDGLTAGGTLLYSVTQGVVGITTFDIAITTGICVVTATGTAGTYIVTYA